MPEGKFDRNTVNKNVSKLTRERSLCRNRKLSGKGHRNRRSRSSTSDSSSSSTSSSSYTSSSTRTTNSSSSSSSSSSSRSPLPASHKRAQPERKIPKNDDLRNKKPKENQNDYDGTNRIKDRRGKSIDGNKENVLEKVEKSTKSRNEIPDSKTTEKRNEKDSEKKIGKEHHLHEKTKEEMAPKSSNKIHVTKITRNVTMDHLKEIFSTWGSVKRIELPNDRFHPEFHLGFAYIEFDDSSSAKMAVLDMHMGQVDGQEVSVAEVPLPPRIEDKRVERDRFGPRPRYRTPIRRDRRSPVRRRSPSRRRSFRGRRSPIRRRGGHSRSPVRNRRPRGDSRQFRHRNHRSSVSPARRTGRERRNRKSPAVHHRSNSSSSSSAS